MSVIQLVRCELYDECKHEFTATFRGLLAMPDDWLMLTQGAPQAHTGMHFCSTFCLLRWYAMRGEVIPVSHVQPEPQEQLPCKARRFLLYDGETADITEGVQWENGHVSLADSGTFCSWERMKEGRDGSGIQWIDQEVSE